MDVSGSAGSLWLALGLGVAFGFFLERAGLGSSVKLAAQFYLRDLTVFKVMFTAIVTAMVGLYASARLGLLEMSLLQVPPTFLVPQLVGGLVFGAGFVIGGYCPGTGCVALASGRLDGLAVVAGMVAGIVVFGEAFELLRPLYGATPLGPMRWPVLIGWPEGVVVLLVAALAVGGFLGAERIERARRMGG
jgi:uncharacterized membrane protein YedE/YeeE